MRSGYVLIGGLAVFLLAAFAIVGWAFLGSNVGKERGLIFKNFGDAPLVLHLNGEEYPFQPQQQTTIPISKSEFPQTLSVSDTSGKLKYQREFQFQEFQQYQFYVGLQDDQFATYVDPTQ